MSRHEVEQGECMASIAAAHDYPSWRELYEHPANAGLRATRPDPFTLKAGDIVELPPREWLKRSCATGKLHVFGHKPPPALSALIHLRFDMSDPSLYARKRYELSIEGEVLEGVTGSDAQLHHAVPLGAKQATLSLWLLGDEEEPEQWRVDLRELDPADTVSGMKGRMINLGLLASEENAGLDDELDDATRDALAAFEAAAGEEELDGGRGGQEQAQDPAAALEHRDRPGFSPGPEYLEVGHSHRLQLVAKTRRVHLRLAAAGGVAYAEQRYELEIEGVVHEGVTDADAELDVEVPARARTGELRIMVEGLEEPAVWTLELDGPVEPGPGGPEEDEDAAEDTRFIAGLLNLGFLAPGKGEDTAAVEQATAVFQAVYGLEPSGEIDGRTLARMRRVAG